MSKYLKSFVVLSIVYFLMIAFVPQSEDSFFRLLATLFLFVFGLVPLMIVNCLYFLPRSEEPKRYLFAGVISVFVNLFLSLSLNISTELSLEIFLLGGTNFLLGIIYYWRFDTSTSIRLDSE